MKFRLCSIIVLFLLTIVLFGFQSDQEKINDWKNPDVICINKENPHCTHYPFDIKEDAILNNPKKLLIHRSNK